MKFSNVVFMILFLGPTCSGQNILFDSNFEFISERPVAKQLLLITSVNGKRDQLLEVGGDAKLLHYFTENEFLCFVISMRTVNNVTLMFKWYSYDSNKDRWQYLYADNFFLREFYDDEVTSEFTARFMTKNQVKIYPTNNPSNEMLINYDLKVGAKNTKFNSLTTFGEISVVDNVYIKDGKVQW